MTDRLARARREWSDITLAANAEFVAAMTESERHLNAAAAAARAANTLIPADVLLARRDAYAAASTALARAISPARVEVDAAIAAARANGTFHFDTAPPRCICGPDSTGEAPDGRPDCPACNATTTPEETDDDPPF